MKRIISLILMVATMASLSFSMIACTPKVTPNPTTNNTQAPIEEFKVGMECAYPPFNWTQNVESDGTVAIRGNNGFAGGYDVEIAKKIAESQGKKLVIVKMIWDGLIPALQSGVIDAIIAGMSPLAERKESIDFTDNYYKSDLVMVVKKGGPYESAKSIQDFSGSKITAQLGTFHYSVIGQINGVTKKTAMKDFGAMRVSLESGIIDGYVSERPEGVSAVAANDKYAMVEFAEGQGFVASDDDVAIAIGIKKGQEELIGKINLALAGISDEERKQIMDNAILQQPSSK